MTPILSICIPTYNRADYLVRLLESIVNQVQGGSDNLEIFISDNASDDNTEAICRRYSNEFSCIRYIRRARNDGADVNISSFLKLASGKYIWIIGDDDYINDGALLNILSLLITSNDIDIINVAARINTTKVDRINYLHFDEYTSSARFSRVVGIWFTFISGVIFNAEKARSVDYLKYKGSCLIQLGWILPLLITGGRYLNIKSVVILGQDGNSGGYKFFEVFSKNLSFIVNDILGTENPSSINIRRSAARFLVLNIATNIDGIQVRHGGEGYKEILDVAFGDLFIYRYFYKCLVRVPLLVNLFIRTRRFIKNFF